MIEKFDFHEPSNFNLPNQPTPPHIWGEYPNRRDYLAAQPGFELLNNMSADTDLLMQRIIRQRWMQPDSHMVLPIMGPTGSGKGVFSGQLMHFLMADPEMSRLNQHHGYPVIMYFTLGHIGKIASQYNLIRPLATPGAYFNSEYRMISALHYELIKYELEEEDHPKILLLEVPAKTVIETHDPTTQRYRLTGRDRLYSSTRAISRRYSNLVQAFSVIPDLFIMGRSVNFREDLAQADPNQIASVLEQYKVQLNLPKEVAGSADYLDEMVSLRERLMASFASAQGILRSNADLEKTMAIEAKHQLIDHPDDYFSYYERIFKDFGLTSNQFIITYNRIMENEVTLYEDDLYDHSILKTVERHGLPDEIIERLLVAKSRIGRYLV